MKLTQVQLDEATYETLRQKAFEKGISMSALLREIVREYWGRGKPRKWTLEDFTFVASGGSEQGDLAPVSEHHDEALVEAYSDDLS